MTIDSNLQENFLQNICAKDVRAFVFLTNGIKLTGKVISFDTDTILLKDNNREQIVFRHAIATVMPEDSE